MKKLRGKRKYYRNLEKEAAGFKLHLGGPNDWYDLWHRHFDMRGRGNNSGRERHHHLRAIFTAFENVLSQLNAYEAPHQAWLFISKDDSGQDALYFHTPNPNQDNFPYTFEGVVWSEEVPSLLAAHMKEMYEVGIADFDGETWYAVRVRAQA